MLKSLKIENFRCFPSFEMQQLGRLNLIVGTNNSGKTSILEAIKLLLSPSLNFEVLGDVIVDRSEYIENEENHTPELVIRHLFYNHQIKIGSKILITGQDNLDVKQEIVISIDNEKIDRNSESPMLCIKRKIDDLEHMDGGALECKSALSKDRKVMAVCSIIGRGSQKTRGKIYRIPD